MTEEKTKGCIIRSRARWSELGEKCNKYFLDLSKSYNKSHIKKNWNPPQGLQYKIEDSKTIVNEMKNYYQQLYTSQGQTSPNLLSGFFNSEPLPRLDDASQSIPQC